MRLHYTTDVMTSPWLNRRHIGALIAIPEAGAGTIHLAFAATAAHCPHGRNRMSVDPSSPPSFRWLAAFKPRTMIWQISRFREVG